MEPISFSYTEENTKAFIFLDPSLHHLTKSDEVKTLVLNQIKKANILNYEPEQITQLIDSKRFDEKILISESTPPKRGTDGYIKYNFSLPDIESILLTHIQNEKQGQISNLSPKSFIIPVKKGDVLAKIIPPATGQAGIDVFGKEIPGKKGKQVSIKTGKNVYLDFHENDAYAYAAIDGLPYFDYDKLSVENIIIADQTNLNTFADTSNGFTILKFEGTVILNCHLPKTARLETTGSIFINSNIDNVKIDAKKDVIINGGVRNKCKITNQGSLFATFLEDSTIITNFLLCKNKLSNCNVKATDGISILGDQGTIVGGTIHSYSNVTTNIIGSNVGEETHIILGLSPTEVSEKSKLITDYNRLKTELNTHIVNIDQYKKYIQKKKASGLKFIDVYEKTYEKSYKEELRIVNQGIAGLQQIKDRHDVISKLGAKAETVSLSALHEIYPGLLLDINGKSFIIKKHIEEGSTFFLKEDVITSVSTGTTTKTKNSLT